MSDNQQPASLSESAALSEPTTALSEPTTALSEPTTAVSESTTAVSESTTAVSEPTGQQQPVAGAQAAPKFNINLVQVADLGCGVLNRMFLKQPKDKAKIAFKDLKNGKSIKLGTLNLQRKKKDDEQILGQLDVAVSLKLDRTAFRGPVNFPSFQAAVQALLMRLTEHLRAKKDLNLLTDERGSALIHVPGVIKVEDNYNVLVMAVQPDGRNAIAINLMFIDPDQYEQLRGSDKTEVVET